MKLLYICFWATLCYKNWNRIILTKIYNATWTEIETGLKPFLVGWGKRNWNISFFRVLVGRCVRLDFTLFTFAKLHSSPMGLVFLLQRLASPGQMGWPPYIWGTTFKSDELSPWRVPGLLITTRFSFSQAVPCISTFLLHGSPFLISCVKRISPYFPKVLSDPCRWVNWTSNDNSKYWTPTQRK